MSSLAEYNNNPGNIRPAKGVTYEGMIGVDDKGFAIFEKPEQGQQALINDLTHKIEKRGIKTAHDFVDVYSPKGDENPEEARDNYKIYLAQKLGLKSTSDPFPENSVKDLAKAVSEFESGNWQNKEAESKLEQENSPKEVPQSVPAGTSEVAQSHAPYQIMGGAIGAGVAGHIEAGKKLLPLVPNLFNKIMENEPNPSRPMTRGGLQNYLNSQIPPNLHMPLSELEKVTGGNKIRTMAEVQAALKAISEVKAQRLQKVDPVTGQGKGIYENVPGKPAVDLSKYEHVPSFGKKVANEIKNAGEIAKSALPSVGRIGIGALGGALSGSELYDAFNQYQKEGPGLHMPSLRNAAQFASGAGGALSMIPTPATQGLGLALQAPELAYQGYDTIKDMERRRRAATLQDTDRMLMNVDPMGNPL